MFRLKTPYVILSCFLLLGATFSNQYLVDIDVKDMLNNRYLHVKDSGEPETIAKGVVQGDVYEKAYANAELNIAKPAVDALDATYNYIADRCEGNLLSEDVTTVFAKTDKGRELFGYLEARDSVAHVEESDVYSDSCERLVECYFYDILTENDKKNLGYTTDTRSLCETIILDAYAMMSTWTQRIQTIGDINHGDELLANAKKDDGPFDLLEDINMIGTMLFTHNDPPPEIHFFDVQMPEDYINNNPSETTPYTGQENNWEEKDNYRRFEPSNGLDPRFPKSIYNDDIDPIPDSKYTPPDEPTEDTSPYTDSAPIGGQNADIQAISASQGPASELAAASTLQNNTACEPIDPEEEETNILELAEIEHTQTYDYNTKLDMDTRVSMALGAMLSPDIEEQYGIDPVIVLRGTGLNPQDILSLMTKGGSLFGEGLLKGNNLEEIENSMKQCFQQFVDMGSNDINTTRKAVRKNITQPTAFTNCIMSLLCFELSDESGRGLYRIKGCTIPSKKSYGVVDNETVMSAEEVIDSFSNVCAGLKESGQLLEHNKTKDARDHKLMRIKFGDKFSFSLSVGFKPLKDKKDPAHEKRTQISNNTYLMENLLGIDDALGFVQQRNKYVQYDHAYLDDELNGIDTSTAQDKKNDAEEAANVVGDELIHKEQHSQLVMYGAMLDITEIFVERNIDYWISLNDITHSMMQRRQQEADEAKKGG